MGGESFGELIFLHNTKVSSFGGIQKLYWRKIFGVLLGSYEFFKYNLCCYNVLKIKTIIMININLSFSKKLVFQKKKCERFFVFPKSSVPLLSKVANKV